jgi:hypothetical protein
MLIHNTGDGMKCQCCGQEIPEESSAKFDEFWKVYPNKVKKKYAMRTWRSRKLDKLADTIINSVRSRVSNDPRWQAGYIPDPTTFLNGDRWEDEVETIQAAITWPTRNEDWLELGKKLGVSPGIGEDWPKLKDRIRQSAGKLTQRE